MDNGVGLILDTCVIMDTDTETEEGFRRIDMGEELIFLILLLINGILIFKSENKRF
jgi:hypothetical protein